MCDFYCNFNCNTYPQNVFDNMAGFGFVLNFILVLKKDIYMYMKEVVSLVALWMHAHLWPQLKFYLFTQKQSLKVSTSCCAGVGGMVGGSCSLRSWNVMLGCSSCSRPWAWLFISYWAASIWGNWCSLSGCQVRCLTSRFLPMDLFKIEDVLILCCLMSLN